MMATGKEQFKLIRLLGVGAFSHAYLAEVVTPDLKDKIGDLVVLKMPLSKAKEKILIQELIHNAGLHLMLSQVRSPYIVSYLGFEFYDDKYVMIMEYADGGSLRNLIESGFDSGPMPLDRSIKYINQLCQGLAAIHSCSLIHRDIKPDNILLVNDNDVAKLADFGIARILLHGQEAMTKVGTYLYMAPEVISGDGGGFSSDIYSLGVTFYEMVTGVNPFIKDSVGGTIDFIRSGNPVNPCEINPEIDRRIGKIILKSISRDHNNRYQTAEELRTAITGKKTDKGKQARQIFEDNPIKRAWYYYQSGKYSEAEALLEKYISNHPSDAAGYQTLGEYYSRCSLIDRSYAVYKKGVLKIPESAILARGLGLSLYKLGRYHQAISALEKSLELGIDTNLERHDKHLLKIIKDKLKRGVDKYSL